MRGRRIIVSLMMMLALLAMNGLSKSATGESERES